MKSRRIMKSRRRTNSRRFMKSRRRSRRTMAKCSRRTNRRRSTRKLGGKPKFGKPKFGKAFSMGKVLGSNQKPPRRSRTGATGPAIAAIKRKAAAERVAAEQTAAAAEKAAAEKASLENSLAVHKKDLEFTENIIKKINKKIMDDIEYYDTQINNLKSNNNKKIKLEEEIAILEAKIQGDEGEVQRLITKKENRIKALQEEESKKERQQRMKYIESLPGEIEQLSRKIHKTQAELTNKLKQIADGVPQYTGWGATTPDTLERSIRKYRTDLENKDSLLEKSRKEEVTFLKSTGDNDKTDEITMLESQINKQMEDRIHRVENLI